MASLREARDKFGLAFACADPGLREHLHLRLRAFAVVLGSSGGSFQLLFKYRLRAAALFGSCDLPAIWPAYCYRNAAVARINVRGLPFLPGYRSPVMERG